MDGLLIRTKDEFDEFYHIGSHRLFLILVPILREIQRTDILPVVGKERYDWLVRRDSNVCDTLLEECQRPLALLAVKKAVERLPVEVIPEGIVQVQQTGTIKESYGQRKRRGKVWRTVFRPMPTGIFRNCRIRWRLWTPRLRRLISMFQAPRFKARG